METTNVAAVTAAMETTAVTASTAVTSTAAVTASTATVRKNRRAACDCEGQ